MINEMRLAGFLFLFIIMINVASTAFGNELLSDLDSTAKLQKINEDPNKFKISIVLALVEHFSIIALAIILFIAFSPYNQRLGAVWVIFRTGEGLILIYNEIKYWGLLNIAGQYSVASGAEKNHLINLGHIILQTKNSGFLLASVLFGIGTLAYSILFVTHGVVPRNIGWLGIVFGILYGLGNGIRLVKPSFVALPSLSGLLILIFELVLGVWLLFYTHIPQ